MHLHRHVPEQMWYTHPAFAIALGGVLPFGAVCIELFFIMSALWLHQVGAEDTICNAEKDSFIRVCLHGGETRIKSQQKVATQPAGPGRTMMLMLHKD